MKQSNFKRVSQENTKGFEKLIFTCRIQSIRDPNSSRIELSVKIVSFQEEVMALGRGDVT